MTPDVVVELQDGRKIYFGGDATAPGLQEVSAAATAAKASKDQFEAALGTLGGLIDTMEKSLATVAKRPDKVEMAFGVSLTADCNLWVVSGEGKAEFTVTLTWGGK
jgi:hypothetical protein